MDNELQFLTSVDVVTQAKLLLKVDTSADTLERNLTATVPANTSVIDVSYQASNQLKAQQYSHAFATAYLQVRTQQGEKAITVQSQKLQAQLTALQKQVASYAGVVAATPSSAPTHQNALVQLDILKNSISNVR